MARISKEQQERIRLQIVEVASKKFSEDGYDNVSTKAIAKEVGIAEGTLFNYFDSKTHLFLEAFGDHFRRQLGQVDTNLDLTGDIVDILYDQLYRTAKMMLKLPRKILSELMIASIKMAKKYPTQFKKFVEMDMQYMEETKEFLDHLQDQGLLREVDTKQLSELVYASMMYEFVMYLYDKTISKEIMLQELKTKLRILLQGYIK